MAWLRTVARHIVIDQYRRRRVHPVETELTPDVEAARDDEYAEVDALLAVKSQLLVLPDEHRATIVGMFVLDQPVRRAGEYVGVPVGTAKSRCYTAMRQLHDQTWPRCS